MVNSSYHIQPLQIAVSLCSRFLVIITHFHLVHTVTQCSRSCWSNLWCTQEQGDLELGEEKPLLLVSKLCSSLKNCYSYPESPSTCSGSLRGNLESHPFARNENHFGLPCRPLDSCWCDSWVWRSSFSEDQSEVRLVQYRPIWSYLGS